jgi:hypothetical protein
MNCQEFWDTMPELEGAPGVELPPHARECQACAAVLDEQRLLRAGLRNVAAGCARQEAPARVEARLLAAFRGQAGMPAPSSRRWWTPLAAWGSATAVVAAASVLLFVHERRPAPQPLTAAELAAVDWTEGWQDEGDAEAATGEFIPLPNAARPAPDENANLVRVEVPRSTMIALGYPVAADRGAELVEADVVLGSDGLARAVRFLDE